MAYYNQVYVVSNKPGMALGVECGLILLRDYYIQNTNISIEFIMYL